MPIIYMIELKEESLDLIRNDTISGEKNYFHRIDHICKKDSTGKIFNYMPSIGGLTDENFLNVLCYSIVVDGELDTTTFTKRNICIIRNICGFILSINFTTDVNYFLSMGSQDDFYVAMMHLKKSETGKIEIDKIVLSKVVFFSKLALQFKKRFYAFRKYNSENNEYKEKESLLYISLSDDNYEEKLAHVLSLPEYKMVRHIELDIC